MELQKILKQQENIAEAIRACRGHPTLQCTLLGLYISNRDYLERYHSQHEAGFYLQKEDSSFHLHADINNQGKKDKERGTNSSYLETRSKVGEDLKEVHMPTLTDTHPDELNTDVCC